jgi:hypothetical protein
MPFPAMPHDHDDNDDDSSESRIAIHKESQTCGDGADRLETRALVAKGGPYRSSVQQIKNTLAGAWPDMVTRQARRWPHVLHEPVQHRAHLTNGIYLCAGHCEHSYSESKVRLDACRHTEFRLTELIRVGCHVLQCKQNTSEKEHA